MQRLRTNSEQGRTVDENAEPEALRKKVVLFIAGVLMSFAWLPSRGNRSLVHFQGKKRRPWLSMKALHSGTLTKA